MYKFDYHLHTNISTDSPAKMQNMIKSAIDKGLNEIAFTDHIDFLDEFGNMIPLGYSFSDYIEIFNYYKEFYKDKIIITFGIELGLMPQTISFVKDFVSKYDFDFIIGSSHSCQGYEIYYAPEFYENKTKEEAYMAYFEEILENVKLFDDFSVYGHLDYIRRYGGYKDNSLEYEDYKDVIDNILTTLISKGKGLEINTSGYRYALDQLHPQFKILKRYRELGGEILTIGSDAHFPKHVGEHFDKAYESAKLAGFKRLTTFRKLKPIFIDMY